ncbi:MULTISPECIES: hypothetical protein [unclassified Nocardioides]|uniref:hypothetical protein n=1 Tax=unclassified Nocardioides TaxID=2615069 RepID=UPI0009EFE8AA|nr:MULTISPECIES: hypothetical protein [unclassified Nocardioides]GAW50620.1 hypothetical protein PD653B2_2956 [Nocardioides sp. PD653-B2]GAW55519.1 hypothetical protein PD653_2944 [Nocardioides sp. PD653]
MQSLTAAPRDGLTSAQVMKLLTGDGVEISAGLELLDTQNRFVDDISDALVEDGSSVSHNGRASAVHGTCSLVIQQALAWGRDRVRPYMVLSNAAVSARFNLGVYVLTTPQTKRGEEPVTYDVDGFDLLQPLQDGPGNTYVVLPEEGDDLMPNPGFEVDTSDYGSYEPFPVDDFTAATFARTTSKHYSGVASLEVTWPTTGAGISWINTTSERHFIVGKTYKFTARVWVPTGGPPSLFFDVLFTTQSPRFFPANDGWVEVEWHWTATVPAAYVALSFRGTTAGQKTWIDEIHVVGQASTCVDAVRSVIELAGAGAPLRIDGTEQLAVMPGPMVWALTDGSPVTWIQIINDLLDAINYRALWVDEDGTYRSEPYVDPKLRPVEWTLDVEDQSTNIVGQERVYDEDVWGKPNWWRFVRRGMATTPVEGDGLYTVENVNRGPSSMQSLGRPVRKTVFLDAVDQAALVAQGDRVVIEDTAVTRQVTLAVDPLPIVGHLDVVRYIDSPVSAKAEVTSSTTNLDGSPGTWVLEVME